MNNDKKITLVIGDKNFSSWSMRAWLVAKQSGVPFEEKLVFLDKADTSKNIREWSSSGKVPCLAEGDLRVWDSLAIAEYFAELAPHAKLWPTNPTDRATARAYAAEMHSGFASLRSQLSMDIKLRTELMHLEPGTIADIKRVISLWETALAKTTGPFLFGEFGIVDAFYTPVVFRFQSYGVPIASPAVQKYMAAVKTFVPVKEWADAGLLENRKPFAF